MYKSGKVYEKVRNYTICVLTKFGVRPMKFDTDIEENLVWINQVTPIGCNDVNFYINEGEYVRYVDIQVVPKFILDKY